MDQYKGMFNTCRIPGIEMDALQTYGTSQTHIIILHNDQIIQLQVCDTEGNPFTFNDILQGFQEAVKLTSSLFELEGHLPISLLTSEQRDTWAKERQHLVTINSRNKTHLEIIESALFVITLHDTAPVALQDRSVECLLGQNSSGRGIWFDKPFNMIIFKNGLVGINGEHTWADAMVVVRQLDWVVRSVRNEWNKVGKKPSATHNTTSVSALVTRPQRLDFVLDNRIKTAIEQASIRITQLNSTVELKVLQLQHFGKDFCKRYKIAADFFMQMAIQLAYYRQHGTVVATYETGHTRLYYHGRTETIRSCSNDSRKFCESMGPRKKDIAASSNTANWKQSRQEQYQALRTAISTHSKTVKDSMMGNGIDRHLLGLQIVATIELSMTQSPLNNNDDNNTKSSVSHSNGNSANLPLQTLPSLFNDPGYLRSKKYLLSTSNVGVGDSRSFGGYSPFFNGGYGCCYSIQDTSINVCISHIRNSGTDCVQFSNELEYALIELRDLILDIHNENSVGSKL